MSVVLSPLAGAGGQFLDNNGVILSGGKVFTYAAGTNTLQSTYTTSAGTIAHTNPIILDSSGRVPGGEIWFTSTLAYKIVVKDSTNVTIATYDNLTGADAAFVPMTGFEGQSGVVQDLAGDSGAAWIGFQPDGGDARSVQSKLRDTVSVKDFGAVGDGIADDTLAIQTAIAAISAAGGGTLNFPVGVYLVTSALSDGGKTIQFVGAGVNESSATFGKVTRLQFNGAISGITLTGNGSGVQWMVLQGDGGAYDSALSGVICKAKVRLEHVYVTGFRGHGFHADHYSDQSCYVDLLAMSNAGNGVYIADTTGGVPDANTSLWLNVDVRVNQGSGVYLASNASFSNTFVNLTSQGNTNYAYFCASTYNNVYGFYSESNTAGGITFASTASNNRVWGVQTSDVITDLSTEKKNWVGGVNEGSSTYNTANLNITTYGGGNPGTFSMGWDGTHYSVTADVGSNNLVMPMTNIGTSGTLVVQPDMVNVTKAAVPVASGVNIGGTTGTTVGAAGGASALPATPLGYILAYVGATPVKIPYYSN